VAGSAFCGGRKTVAGEPQIVRGEASDSQDPGEGAEVRKEWRSDRLEGAGQSSRTTTCDN